VSQALSRTKGEQKPFCVAQESQFYEQDVHFLTPFAGAKGRTLAKVLKILNSVILLFPL
jgi:hypothetical protein